MLELRILKTIQFFHLQDIAPTAFEIYKYLLTRTEDLASSLDEDFNLISTNAPPASHVPFGAILQALIRLTAEKKVACVFGTYVLPEHASLAPARISGYVYGIARERRIRRFLRWLRFVPFIRAVSVGGSQALGLQTEKSDIDLVIITHSGFLWLARIFSHILFDGLLMCRHGQRIENRFCLNHYIAGTKLIDEERNLLRAFQYVRMRPVFGIKIFTEFLIKNQNWLRLYFPNWYHISFKSLQAESQAIHAPGGVQGLIEKIFDNPVGLYIENMVGRWQLERIKRGNFSVAEPSELALHSTDLKYAILETYYNRHKTP
ncbi:MAG TPA: nucleotidyltransferase domain-containing protein [Patescibacteria group bacterium]|nr:nucleotidyltransferase domain-containing protein [Patescibacteria group bacterium]